jgi:tight adherence protein B
MVQILAVFFLVSVAIGGVAYVFLYPSLSGERKAAQRMQSVASTEPLTRAARGPQKSRRDAVESTLKELEQRQKKSKSVPLSVRIARAGLSWSKRQFAVISAIIGLGMFALGFLAGTGLLVAAGLGFAGAFGVPRWLLSFLKRRREAKFLEALPDAVDIIVRGVKAGLPLLDCIKMITLEAPEPLRSEFRLVMETQAIGMPLGEACSKLYERTPLPEANFFGIVVAIQQKAGGNLSEALGNLSKVLRDRKKMRAKIQAMSQEAMSACSCRSYCSRTRSSAASCPSNVPFPTP